MVKEINKKAEGEPLNREDGNVIIKALNRRWWILFMFMYYAGANAFQWIEYSSITPIIVRYYNVSSLAVDWTSTIYMAVYPFLVIPASFLIDKNGVRPVVLLGCFGTFLASVLKVFSIHYDRFWIVLLGNTIAAFSAVVIMCLPAKIASLWFKANEVSTACSLGMLGSQMGTAIGYILPPFLVHNHPVIEDIGANLRVLCWGLAIFMVPVTIAVFVYFPNQPPLPPTNVQAILRKNKPEFDSKVFFTSVKNLFKTEGFILHFLCYGINIAVYSAIGTLLSQFILSYFENAHTEAGIMGFSSVLTGLVGMLVFGIILDKTHRYKECSFLCYFLAVISIIGFMYSLKFRLKILTYITNALLGTFLNAYLMVGFEFCMELAFPAEESTTGGILISGSQFLGVIFTVAVGYLNKWVGPFWALASQALLLVIGTILTAFVPNNLNRQEAFKKDDPKYSIRKASYFGPQAVFIE